MIVLLSLLAQAQAAAEPLDHDTAKSQADSVTTKEENVTIGGDSFRHIQFENHDYYLSTPRPGSVLVEVRCRKPEPAPAPNAKAAGEAKSALPMPPASRSREFVNRLADGCAPKLGVQPERFTFEQSENKTARLSQEASKPKQKAESPEARSLPPDLDPHVLPDPVTPGSTFDEGRKQY